MIMQLNPSQSVSFVVAGYVRRSSYLQKDNFSIDAQKRTLTDESTRRGLPAPVFYEDDERSARSEQIAKRPAFKKLLEDVEAGRIQMVMVHSFDRWSRNVMVTLQSFRILASHHTAFVSLSEHIDYSTPEGKLQLTILAAFAAYFSDMLSKHTSKGKSERATQGLFNGTDVPYGYRRINSKLPSEPDPATFPGLRILGELRMQGIEAQKIADMLNEAGYRVGSEKRGYRLFTKSTVNQISANEFYAAFDTGDDRGTIIHQGQRYRGQHQAAFTYEEWQQIRAGAGLNYHAPSRGYSARRSYEFSGYIACAQCGVTLRCQGSWAKSGISYSYYRDAAKARQLPCPAGGNLLVRAELVREQFGALLGGLSLPEQWREIIRQKMLQEAERAGIDRGKTEREKERLKLKRSRILKQHRDGYIDDEEMASEIAAVELALRGLSGPEVNGFKLDEVIAAGERLPGIAALWNVATPEERRQMTVMLLQSGGLHYDLQLQMIAAIKPQSVFLPTLRLIEGVAEYEEASGLLVVSLWREKAQCA